MEKTEQQKRAQRIADALPNLSEGQIIWIEDMISQFSRPFEYTANLASDLITDRFLVDFGDTLRVHHCFSKQAFTKDKFEYVFERVSNLCGIPAIMAPKNNPGYDILVANQKISLKTEAAANLNLEKIHISKFMELGKPIWTDNPGDLIGLRVLFLDRVAACDRIITLRAMSKAGSEWYYELVEIPKQLLEKAITGDLKMMVNSRQVGAKPGYCFVRDDLGNTLFELYFDGGSERKLRIQKLLKTNCIIHATWSFSLEDILGGGNAVQ